MSMRQLIRFRSLLRLSSLSMSSKDSGTLPPLLIPAKKPLEKKVISNGKRFANGSLGTSCPLCGLMMNDPDMHQHLKRVHEPVINQRLLEDPISTYEEIFGLENFKSKNSREMRWKGGIVVSLNGEYIGWWTDWKQGKGGLPISAVMHAMNLNYQDALVFASKLASLDKSDFFNSRQQPEEIKRWTKKSSKQKTKEMKEKELLRDQKRIENARNIWKLSKPIQGTLGWKYLSHHRKIPKEAIDHSAFQFVPEGSEYTYYDNIEDKEVIRVFYTPAVLVPIENDQAELVGVQSIYLNRKTAKKQKAAKSKITYGLLKGNAAVIHRGQVNPDKLVIAEGPETAASLIEPLDALNKQRPVLASLSLSNIQNLSNVLINFWKPKEVIIAADNDGNEDQQPSDFDQLKNQLVMNGIKFSIKRPPLSSGYKKFDWNDALKEHGPAYIQEQFE